MGKRNRRRARGRKWYRLCKSCATISSFHPDRSWLVCPVCGERVARSTVSVDDSRSAEALASSSLCVVCREPGRARFVKAGVLVLCDDCYDHRDAYGGRLESLFAFQ